MLRLTKGASFALNEPTGSMFLLRQLWICIILLGLGLGPITIQALQISPCCCVATSESATCTCENEPGSLPCGITCAPERAEAVLLPALLAPQNTVAAVLVAPMVIVCMVEPGSLRPDSRPEIPAGWVLPTSPPLMPSLLNLPPPPRPC
jgi:hypothetical protein